MAAVAPEKTPGSEGTEVQFRTSFLKNNPSHLWQPSLFAIFLVGLWTVPSTSTWLDANKYEPFGVAFAVQYFVFAIMLLFSVHGFVCCFEDELAPIKLQKDKPMLTKCRVIAERSFFTLLTTLLYAGYPVTTEVSTSWCSMAIQWLVLNAVWDFWFFLAHWAMHAHPSLYKAFHKTHHTYTDPNCFVAYFVAYGSHFVTEGLPMLVFGLIFSREVLVFTLYFGTLGTYLHHAGYDISTIKLMKPWPGASWDITVGTLLPHVPFVSQGVSLHDIHHFDFVGNYALSFTYLDKIFGSFVTTKKRGPGRTFAKVEETKQKQ